MQRQFGESTVELLQGDITQQSVDAIVNAANRDLAGGGGVDGAIHRRGGPQIMAETRRLYPHGCPTGSAVITAAGELPARYVIHAVGPIWGGGGAGEDQLLAAAYQRSLELAGEHQCESVALPALSTGAYGYPFKAAAFIAIRVACEFARGQAMPKRIRFVLFNADGLQHFQSALQQIA